MSPQSYCWSNTGDKRAKSRSGSVQSSLSARDKDDRHRTLEKKMDRQKTKTKTLLVSKLTASTAARVTSLYLSNFLFDSAMSFVSIQKRITTWPWQVVVFIFWCHQVSVLAPTFVIFCCCNRVKHITIYIQTIWRF